MKSHIQIAEEAIDMLRPSIESLFERTNRKELHIVVMNPSLKPWESDFENAVLYEKSIGSPEDWTIPFDQYARNKAKQAWRNNSSNVNQQSLHPSSLQDDDLLFYGSFVYGDIVVACSGVQQWFDMLVSGWVAVAIEQLTIAEYQRVKTEAGSQTHRKIAD
ncbi:hypothetical protein DBZ36_00565 [Alginatibacterium sediminis]|uniref:Uncharacterized protein n=1 Tax=Alginatibacterium sediminis TaxID=2164068 RepID=A0A420END9_9ALTE|nr:hypothetical protein [Alginatibacterium sediminis]RKF22173.1 hypothetical protein DBZ36_00565 [Alginatibacterium sediminis]